MRGFSPSTSPGRLLLALLLATCGQFGCEGPEVEPADSPHAQANGARIVSLSPALTRVLIDLGQRESIVGRTRYAPPGLEDVPVVGDLLDPDLERITAVAPNLLIVQPSARGVDPDLARHAMSHGWHLASWHIDRLEDVERVVAEMPDVLARADGNVDHARAAATLWRTRLAERLRPSESVKGCGETLILYAVDPPAAFGRETYIDDVFTAMGGRNALDRPGYPTLSLEDVLRLDPDTIIVLAHDTEDARTQVETLAEMLPSRGGSMRMVPVGGGNLLVPGTCLVNGIAELNEALSEPSS